MVDSVVAESPPLAATSDLADAAFAVRASRVRPYPIEREWDLPPFST
jgi:hypothetical protein